MNEGQTVQNVLQFRQRQSDAVPVPARQDATDEISTLIANLKVDGQGEGFAAERARRAAKLIEKLT